MRHGRVLADGAYPAVPELVTRASKEIGPFVMPNGGRVLRDHRRRGVRLDETTAAVAALHNLKVELAKLA